MRRVLAISAAVVALLGSTAFAAEDERSSSGHTIEFEGRKWRHDASDRVFVEQHRGKTALRVQGTRTTSSVYLPEVEFQDGAIEVDFAAIDRSIAGIGFRGRDNENWCNTIMFNRAWPGKDRDEVEQAIVTRRVGTVLVLNIRRSEEDTIRHTADGPEWFHVKVVVQRSNVQVYLNGSEEPDIEVGAVFDPNEKGVVGLCGRHFYFANFRYTTAE